MIAFVLVKVPLFLPGQADENVYNYAGWLIADGVYPWRDFFFAHPPLQPYTIALFGSVFGFTVVALKTLPLLWALLSAGLVYALLVGRTHPAAAVFGVAVTLFTYGFLRESSFSHGIGMANCLLLAGALALDRGFPVRAAVALTLAALTRLSVGPAIIAILGMGWLYSGRAGLRAAVISLALFAASMGALALAFGANFLDPVLYYHFAKPPDPEAHAVVFGQFWHHDYYLIWLAAGGAALALLTPAGRADDDRIGALAVVVLLAYALLMSAASNVFTHYILLLFPWMAILAARLAHLLVRTLSDMAPESRGWSAAAVVAVVAAVVAHRPLTKSGVRPGPITHFVQTMERHQFASAPAIAEWIADHSRRHDTISGDAMQTPLIAMLAGRRMAGDLVDLNPMRFQAGMPTPAVAAETLRAARPAFVVVWRHPRADLYRFAEIRAMLEMEYQPTRRYGPFSLLTPRIKP